jgi:hypothetical protein
MTLVMPDMDDPFAGITEARTKAREEIITGGRYRLPNRDGTHKKGGWQRVTNLVAAFSDQFGLRMWEIEQVIKAVAWDHGILDELMVMVPYLETLEKQAKRDRIEAFLERCKNVAGGAKGSKFGTLRHAQVEAMHEDRLPAGATDAHARKQLHLYRAALTRHRLRAVEGMQERRILIEQLGAIGTCDNVLEDLSVGLLGIGDLKSQRRFWTWLEVSAQFASYAHGDAMWEPSEKGGRSGRWVDMPKVRLDIAYILHMPRETLDAEGSFVPGDRVDIYEVDIVRGWQIALLAKRWHGCVRRLS